MHRMFAFSMSLVFLAAATLQADDKKEKPNKPKKKRRVIRVQPGATLIRRGNFVYRGPNKLYLLRNAKVQKELKLDGDQKKEVQEAIQDIGKSRRDLFQKLRGLKIQERRKKSQELNKKIRDLTNTKLKDVLQPEQAKRLDQISLHLQGANVFRNPDVVKTLKITDEQKEKMNEAQRAGYRKRSKLFQDLRAGNVERKNLSKKLQELKKEADTKVMGVLSKEQQAQLKKMKGKPFALPQRRFGIRAVPAGKIRINGKKIKRIRVKPRQVRPQKAKKASGG